MKKKLIAIGLAALVLAGCSAEPEEFGNPSGYEVEVVELPDGREVVCVTWADYKKGGITCDWDSAK